MKTLALYADDNGEAQQCVITHEGTARVDQLALPNYNDGSTLFFINLYDDDERPDVVDCWLNEVPCHFIQL